MPSKSKSRSSLGAAASTSTGILGGVFNFVSKEFESFVANATANTSFAASSSRRTLDDDEDDDEYDDDEEEEEQEDVKRRRARYSRHRSITPPPRKHKSRSRRYSPTSSPPPSELPKHKQRRGARSPSPTVEDHQPEEHEDTRLMRPPPPPTTAATQRCLKRKPSRTMPGSLFPRSPSMEPSELDATRYREQHVRFAAPSSHAGSPVQRERRNSASLMPPPTIHSSPGGTPRKSPLAPTIKAVVNRFHVGEGDADSSILLPSPHHSPEALARSAKRSSDKGKGRAIESDDEDFLDSNVSGVLRVKGKERELSTMREDLERHEQRMMEFQGGDMSFQMLEEERSLDKERIRVLEDEITRLKQELAFSRSTSSFPPPPPPPPPPPLFPPPKKTLIPTSSADESAMFASVRAHLKHAPPPVEKPINPGTGRRPGKPTVGVSADQMAAFLTEMKTVRLRKVTDKPEAIADRSFRATSPLRVSAASLARSASRASLRQRPPKGDSSFENSASEPEGPSRRLSLPQRIPRDSNAGVNSTSVRNGPTSRGEKRKEAPGDDERVSSRRRVSSSQDTSFSSTGSNASFSQSDTLPPPSLTESVATSTTSKAGPSSSSRWQSSSVTDAPTPSLCSDNEQETSPDDVIPSTPPAVSVGPSRGFYRFRGKGVPVDEFDRSMYDHDVSMREPDHESEPEREPEMVHDQGPAEHEPQPEHKHESEPEQESESDQELEPEHHTPQEPVPRLDPSPQIRHPAPASATRQTKALSNKTSLIPRPVSRPRGNLFDRRPPSSPMPENSPRRPKAPPRSSKIIATTTTSTRASTANARHSDDDDDDIDAPLAMQFSPASAPVQQISRRASSSRQSHTPQSTRPQQQPLSRSASASSTHSRSRKPLPKSPHPNKTRAQHFTDDDEANEQVNQPVSTKAKNVKNVAKRGSTTSAAAAATSNSRRQSQTLDQEIREAELPPTAKEILDDFDHHDDGGYGYEEEVMTAVGTRDNYGGFMAHGGAGGPAVFMGVGYVEGARDARDAERRESNDYGHGELINSKYARRGDDHDEYHPASDEGDADEDYIPTPPRTRRR